MVPDPTGCDLVLRAPLEGLVESLFVFLKTFEDQYKYDVASFFDVALAQLSGLSPSFIGADYSLLITELTALGLDIPAGLAEDLAALDAVEAAAIIKLLVANATAVLTELLAKIEGMCHGEIANFINSGLFASLVNGIFMNVQPAITAAGNSLFNAQLELLQSLPISLPPAAIALITPFLQVNRTAFVTFFTAMVSTVLTAVQADVAALVSGLAALVATEVVAFDALAVSELTLIVNRIFIAPSFPLVEPVIG